MEDDLAQEVQRACGDRADTAIALIETYGSEVSDREVDRVQGAIWMLGGEDSDRLRHYVEVARQDYRDVLYWAEYPPDPDEPKSHEELRARLGLPPEA